MSYRLTFFAFSLPLLTACGGGSGGTPDDDNSVGGGDGAGEGGSGSTSGNVVFGEPKTGQIRPGVTVSSDSGSCTSNFIYTANDGKYYIGAAAHCFSEDSNSGIDPCNTRNAAIGSPVTIQNASRTGKLAYTSWQAMQSNSETPGQAVCLFNDFAIVEIDAADVPNLHPSAIAWGGPTRLLRGNANVNDRSYSYGQSPAHAGIRSLEEKDGPVSSQDASGWQYNVAFDNPGLSGDSGSAVLHESGAALGVLTVVSASVGLGIQVDNGVANLEMALDYANDFTGKGFTLVVSDDFNR